MKHQLDVCSSTCEVCSPLHLWHSPSMEPFQQLPAHRPHDHTCESEVIKVYGHMNKVQCSIKFWPCGHSVMRPYAHEFKQAPRRRRQNWSERQNTGLPWSSARARHGNILSVALTLPIYRTTPNAEWRHSTNAVGPHFNPYFWKC